MLLARIKMLIGTVAIALSLGACVPIPVPPSQAAACPAQPPDDTNQTKQVIVQMQPSDSSQPIIRNCVTMIVTYKQTGSTQIVLLAQVLDPATGGIRVTKTLQPFPISNVMFYWSEGTGGTGARRAFVLDGPPDGMDWNAIQLGWGVLGARGGPYEYETFGFAKLP